MKNQQVHTLLSVVAKSLEEAGMPEPLAKAQAKSVLLALATIAPGSMLPTSMDVERADLDAKIWALREIMTVPQLSERFGKSPRAIYKAIGRHLLRRQMEGRVKIPDEKAG
jgi:hypothetical protein